MLPNTNSNPHRAEGLPQGTLLLTWLLLLTAYRLWVIPRLGISLYVDEAQYWTWAQQLDWGYYSKPPVIAWLIGLTTALFGDGPLAVKLPSLILYPATSWLIFRLGTRLFDPRVGFRAGIAFSLLPIVSALGLFVSTDAPLMFFWALAMTAFVRALDKNLWRDWLLLGMAVGLGIMSKYTMAAFGASALLYLLVEPSRRRTLANPRLWAAVALAALLVAPNILWNWSHDFPTLRHTADITHVEGVNDKSGNPGEFLLAQVGSLGPGLAVAFLCGLIAAWRHRREDRMQLLTCFSVPLLALVFAQAARSEANGNWAAPALYAATLLAVAWLTRLRARWWTIAIGINVVLMLGVYHLGDVLRVTGTPMTAKIDPYKRMRGWDTLAHALRPYMADNPHAILLADNRTLLAHMLYELRDAQPDYAAWAPNTHPQDHYQLVQPLRNEAQGRPILLLSQDDPTPITSRFTSARQIGRITVQVEPGLRRELNVILLEGFKGYQ
ncbi:MAG: glycosyltransferase family 39 protein [Rhodocyclaceae bacterium]